MRYFSKHLWFFVQKNYSMRLIIVSFSRKYYKEKQERLHEGSRSAAFGLTLKCSRLWAECLMWLLNVCLEAFCQMWQMNNIHGLSLFSSSHTDFASDTSSNLLIQQLWTTCWKQTARQQSFGFTWEPLSDLKQLNESTEMNSSVHRLSSFLSSSIM